MISSECYEGNHHLCSSVKCECQCHDDPYPDTGESGDTYNIEMEQNIQG